MKKMILFSFLITSVHAKESDPNGWTKAKWGMTQDAVKKAFKGNVPERVTIADHEFKVRYDYDSSGKLEGVMLSLIEEKALSVIYKSVSDILKEKYGKPETEETRFENIRKQKGNTQWHFKTTIVILEMAHNMFLDEPIKYLVIEYKKAGISKKAENL